MFSPAMLAFIWFSGLLAGHFCAVLFEKQQVVEDLLTTYVDVCLHAMMEGAHTASIFLQHLGSIIITLSNYLGCWLENSLNYIGSSTVATLLFTGSAISETVNFIGITVSNALRVSGQVLSHSLDYMGASASATILFVLGVMEKLASLKILYTFLFFLILYLLWKFPGGLQHVLRSIFLPLQEGINEFWRVSTRAIFLVWNSMKLTEVLKFLLVIVLLTHLKNNMFC